ncbi:MAG: RNA polymerase sigma factor [Eggerthellaceae bacterium]|nr:RNA polymerase sigma factor [Eggerthellaceae bacterium]
MKTVYRVCYSFLGNAPDAEDATQQVFMKLVDSPRSFASEGHERAWLIVCAQNLCKDILKSASRTRRADMPDDLLDTRASAEGDGVLEAVLALPDIYKECIYLYYYEGYSTAEIATLTGAPPSTVRNRMADARKLLKEALGGEQA